MLILDLDNTIFETRSMDKSSFAIIIDMIRDLLTGKIGNNKVNALIEEFWHKSFDVVMNNFNVAVSIQKCLVDKINSLEFNLDISTYEDYHHLHNLGIEQVLVTTGFRSLQLAKVKALGIEQDFREIHIDNPYEEVRLYKKGIFEKIIENLNYSPKEIWVIGDNPESELKAAHELGLRTIQRIRPDDSKSTYAEYDISSFEELRQIIK